MYNGAITVGENSMYYTSFLPIEFYSYILFLVHLIF